jgi:hypothetical protein
MFSQPEGYVAALQVDKPYTEYVVVDLLAHQSLLHLSCPYRHYQPHSSQRHLLAQLR